MSEEKVPFRYRLLADLALLIVTAIWGATFFMVDQAVETVNVFTFISLRFSTAFVVLMIIFGYSLFKNKICLKDVLRGILIGVFLFLGYVFQTFGMDFGTAPGKAAFITGLSVVLVPIFSALLLKKKPHYLSWFGIAVAVVGLGLLSITDLSVFQSGRLLGDFFVVLCAFCFAFHIISIDKFVEKTHFTTLAIVQTGTTTFLAWVTALIFSPFPQIFTVPVFPIIFNNQVIFAFLFTGIIATALIIAVQTFAQKRTSPIHVAVIFAMEPVFAAIFALIFTDEILLARQWIGCGLILVSMVAQQLIDYYFVQRKQALEEQPSDQVEKLNTEVEE